MIKEEVVGAMMGAAAAHLQETACLQDSLQRALAALHRLAAGNEAASERHRAEALADAERGLATLESTFRAVALRQALLEQAIADTQHAARVWFYHERGGQ